MIACQKGNTEIVSELLQNGVSPDSLDRSGRSALVMASFHGHTEIAELLLSYGATADMVSMGLSPLLLATKTEIIKILIKYGAQVDLKVYDGNTPLVHAVQTTPNGFKLLIEHGAQVDLPNNYGRTALMMASKTGNIVAIRVLLEKNAQINLKDNKGMTSLIFASCNGHTEAVRMLLEHGALVDLPEETSHQTALLSASLTNQIETVQLLLDHGAQVNWKDKNGRTALIIVAQHNKSENVADLYIAASAEKSLEGDLHKLGITVQGYDDKWTSQSLGSSELLKLLLDHGAEVDLQDSDGSSALMVASGARNIEVVKLLLEHNAQVHLADKNGVTALALASASESPEIVRLLITHGKKENDTENKSTPLSEREHPQATSAIGHPKDPNSHDDQVVITTASAPAQGEQEIPRSKTGEGQDKHTLPSDNNKVPVQHSPLPSTIEKKQEKPVITTDVSRSKLPRSKTYEGQDTHTPPLDNRESSIVNHPPRAIPLGHTEIPKFPSTVKTNAEKKGDAPEVLDSNEASLTIPNVFNELKLFAGKWNQIGILLDMDPGTLEIIDINNPHDAIGCIICMIKEWLNRINPRPTWEKLVEATKVFNEKKSEEIRLKYSTTPPN